MLQPTPCTVLVKALDELFDGYGVSGIDARMAACGLMEELYQAGYVIAPREPTDAMYMCGGNAPISNAGKNGRNRRECIGDTTAAEAWRVMMTVARDMSRDDLLTVRENGRHQP